MRWLCRLIKKAAAAQLAGKFESEIIPVTLMVEDSKGNEVETTVTKDEGIRGDTTLDGLGKLKPAFKQGGSTTAGNSSQVSDGAAAVLLMRRSKATELKLKPLARFLAFSANGVEPSLMGIGPVAAIPPALKQAGLSISDIDIFEINEAFASQAAYCVQKLGIPAAKLNPNGGGIALGHPLGCTGARQIATLLPEMKRTKSRFGVTSMCIGTGMGAASVIENEQ